MPIYQYQCEYGHTKEVMYPTFSAAEEAEKQGVTCDRPALIECDCGYECTDDSLSCDKPMKRIPAVSNFNLSGPGWFKSGGY